LTYRIRVRVRDIFRERVGDKIKIRDRVRPRARVRGR
jgi:hypothetical protein